MNIFFYTTRESDAANCYLEQLRGLPVLKEMTIFPAGSLFHSPLTLQLRSGDLLILFAANAEELDELLALRNEFNDFRIILILADSETLGKVHPLNPRFIAFQEEKMMQVEAVIQKITGSDKGNQCHRFAAYRPDWHLWRLTKTERGNSHINLDFLFQSGGFLQMFTSWRPIIACMKNRAREMKLHTPSINIAMLLSLFVGVGTYFKIPTSSGLRLSLH